MEKSVKSMQNSSWLIKVENQFLVLSAKLKNYITNKLSGQGASSQGLKLIFIKPSGMFFSTIEF